MDSETTTLGAIIAAVIMVVGSIVALLIQTRKEGEKVKEIKDDTEEIKPKVDRTDENVKEMKKDLDKTILPRMKSLTATGKSISSSVGALLEESNYRKRLQQDMTIKNYDEMTAGLAKIYEENARLASRNSDLVIENSVLKQENAHLKQTIRQFEQKQEPEPPSPKMELEL